MDMQELMSFKEIHWTEKNVLVAMKFGDDTKKLREAIRLGISDAGILLYLLMRYNIMTLSHQSY